MKVFQRHHGSVARARNHIIRPSVFNSMEQVIDRIFDAHFRDFVRAF